MEEWKKKSIEIGNKYMKKWAEEKKQKELEKELEKNWAKEKVTVEIK